MPGEGRIAKRDLKNIWLLAVASIVLIIDQLTKPLALKMLSTGSSIPVIKGIFHLTLVFNRGAAFGILKGQNIFFIIIGIIAALVILGYIPRSVREPNLFRIGCALILGGIVGNLVDRLRYGCVVDFLDLGIWPVFNVADSCITIGAVLICIQLLKLKTKK